MRLFPNIMQPYLEMYLIFIKKIIYVIQLIT